MSELTSAEREQLCKFVQTNASKVSPPTCAEQSFELATVQQCIAATDDETCNPSETVGNVEAAFHGGTACEMLESEVAWSCVAVTWTPTVEPNADGGLE